MNPYVVDGAFVQAWLAAFALTQVVEAPIYCVALADFKWASRIAAALGASTITHPIVWFGFVAFWPFGWDQGWGYWSMVVAAELFAFGVEAVYLHLLRVPAAWLWSLGANLISVSTGFLLQELGIM